MAKDYQVECAELRGRIKELSEQLAYERTQRDDRTRRDEGLRDKFKELLLDVLGR